ncbi:MAG: hypothetical protein LBH18_03020 [Spirochaetaceae bacterium]|jgi:hypothetical protein|nr:hypothetical protein [Spirochaetaceae bacterium]
MSYKRMTLAERIGVFKLLYVERLKPSAIATALSHVKSHHICGVVVFILGWGGHNLKKKTMEQTQLRQPLEEPKRYTIAEKKDCGTVRLTLPDIRKTRKVKDIGQVSGSIGR